jgi:hypothetical protein
MIDVSNMTANEIDAEIERLRKLHRSGEITASQATDLLELRFARKRIGLAGRRRWP